MFTPNQLEALPTALEGQFKNLENRIMEDIVRRLRNNGNEIIRSADWQMYRLSELGKSKAEIKKAISNALDLSDKEVDLIYSDILKAGYSYNEKVYNATGKRFIPFGENKQLQQLVSAISMQTKGEFGNIANSLGFAKRQLSGKLQFQKFDNYFQDTMDNAMLDIASGAFDYNTVLKRVVKEMTNSGVRTIDYESGRNNRVDVASRRALMTGFNQVVAKVNEDNAQALNTKHFEVSWHMGARPTHQEWHGKVYSEEELVSVCGLGTGAGLCGWNCYHSYSPFVLGVSERTYTDEWLANMNKQENTPTEFGGNKYTMYEATQKQRRLETTLRAQRQEIKLLELGGANEDDIINARCRYRVTSGEYTRFSRTMGLPQQRERVNADGLGNIGVGRFTNTPKKRIINVAEEFLRANPVELPDGTVSNLVKNSKIIDIEVFAGKGSSRDLRVKEFLVKNYGGKASEWQHTKGRGYINTVDGERKAMLHWLEEKTVGIVELKFKGWSKK